MFGWHKRVAVALGAVVVVAGGLLATTVLAATPTPTPGSSTTQRTNYGQVFLGKLAAALNVDQATLDSKIKQAEKDTIDQAVANGDLAANTATAEKQRIDKAPAGSLGGFGFGFGKGERGGPGARGFAGRAPQGARVNLQPVEQAVADALGIQVADLQSGLKSGQTLTAIAQAHGKQLADVEAAAVTAVKAQLDPQVKAGNLTQAQEDSIVQRFQNGQIFGFGPRGQRAPNTAPKTQPAPTATPSGSSS